MRVLRCLFFVVLAGAAMVPPGRGWVAGDDVKKAAGPADQASLLKTFRDEFVEITPGQGKFPAKFVMGTDKGPWSEGPAHVVTFSYSFAIAKYEVPQNLYQAVMEKNPSRWKGPRNSVEEFTFDEAAEFCRRTTKLLREAKWITNDQVIRIPTEAEWEYCCRAGTSTPYSFGESATAPGDIGPKASILNEFGWHTGNAAGNDPPVGAKKPNEWGLYDMHGYLWEFVADTWHETYKGAPVDGSAWDPSVPETPRRVVRGGSWQERYECHRSAFRRPIAHDYKNDAVGLRCVLANVPK